MSVDVPALAALLTLGMLALYELQLWRGQRRQPAHAHAGLRLDWFDAVSSQPGSELLAVQTLRNALMSATMTASTALLGLMGTVGLTAPLLRSDSAAAMGLHLALLALLLASLLTSAMAVRDYKHASFIVAMPVATASRQRWEAAGRRYLARAGRLYSWSLRQLVLVGPVLAALLHPLAGPVAALLMVGLLLRLDRGIART